MIHIELYFNTREDIDKFILTCFHGDLLTDDNKHKFLDILMEHKDKVLNNEILIITLPMDDDYNDLIQYISTKFPYWITRILQQ